MNFSGASRVLEFFSKPDDFCEGCRDVSRQEGAQIAVVNSRMCNMTFN